jgi:hypothetical protein
MKAIITIEKIDGVNNINVKNDDYSPFELVGIMEYLKSTILNHIASHITNSDNSKFEDDAQPIKRN